MLDSSHLDKKPNRLTPERVLTRTNCNINFLFHRVNDSSTILYSAAKLPSFPSLNYAIKGLHVFSISDYSVVKYEDHSYVLYLA